MEPPYYDEPLYDYYFENGTDNDTYYLDGSLTSNLPGSQIYLPILYSLMFFSGFLGNLFVIAVLGTKRRRQSRLVDTFVVNLAMADLIFVLTLPFWAISAGQHGQWNFGWYGNVLCKLSSYIIAVNRFSNIAFLTCMSVDRYLAVVRLMDSRFRSSQCIQLTCVVVWVVSLVLGIPTLVYRSVTEKGREQFCLDDDESRFFLGLCLATVFLTFALPVMIILLCYGTIVTRLRKQCISSGNPRAASRLQHSLKMVFTIIVVFVMSWLPFNVFKMIIISFQLSDADYYVPPWQSNGLILSCCLAFLNSCMNPVIYFFLDRHFRHRAESLCLSCMGKADLLQTFTSSVTNNGTTESIATASTRNRLQSFDQKIF